MNFSKLKIGFGLLVVAGATIALMIQHQAQGKLREENESLRQQLAQFQADGGKIDAAPCRLTAKVIDYLRLGQSP